MIASLLRRLLPSPAGKWVAVVDRGEQSPKRFVQLKTTDKILTRGKDGLIDPRKLDGKIDRDPSLFVYPHDVVVLRGGRKIAEGRLHLALRIQAKS